MAARCAAGGIDPVRIFVLALAYARPFWREVRCARASDTAGIRELLDDHDDESSTG